MNLTRFKIYRWWKGGRWYLNKYHGLNRLTYYWERHKRGIDPDFNCIKEENYNKSINWITNNK